MFEDYQFEGVSIGIQPILTLYARGQLSSHSQFSDICNYLHNTKMASTWPVKVNLETAHYV